MNHLKYNRLYMFCALLIALFSFNNCKTTATSNSNKGFVKIFDGKTLNGWEGDSTYWRAEHGVLVGEVTPATILKRNSFIIWRGGVTNDFELRVTYRISKQGNSGINYRSEELPGLPYSLKGYQSDIDGANRYTGQNYEERGRTFLALPGQTVRLQTGQKPTVLDSAASRETLKASIKMDDWNECRLIVKGNHMQHYINGVLMSDVTDDDSANRKLTGLLGVQVHVGPPMKIEYKEFLLKKL